MISATGIDPISLFFNLFKPKPNKPKPNEVPKGNDTDENPKKRVNYNVKDNARKNNIIYYTIGAAIIGFAVYKIVKKNK